MYLLKRNTDLYVFKELDHFSLKKIVKKIIKLNELLSVFHLNKASNKFANKVNVLLCKELDVSSLKSKPIVSFHAVSSVNSS